MLRQALRIFNCHAHSACTWYDLASCGAEIAEATFSHSCSKFNSALGAYPRPAVKVDRHASEQVKGGRGRDLLRVRHAS